MSEVILEFEEDEEIEEGIEDLAPDQQRVYSDKADLSVYELYRRHRRGRINLQPDFQRFYVWGNGQIASRLVESILLEIPVPVIYLSEEEDGTYVVIDGQQRLTALFNFLDNEYGLRGLEVLTDLNRRRFQDLPDDLQDKLENSTLRVIQIRKQSHPDVRFEIFKRLNSGSVKLNDQELRNCVYRGAYNDLLTELANDADFQQLLGLKEPHNRMRDREMVLRFCAFQHSSHLNYKPSMKRFLNSDMRLYRQLNEVEQRNLTDAFRQAIRLSKTVFGKYAFRRFKPGGEGDVNGVWEERRVNKGLYDIVMYGFARYPAAQIVPAADAVREELIWLMTHDDDFIRAITVTTDNKPHTEIRFNKWLASLESVVGAPSRESRSFSLQLKEELWQQDPTCQICGQRIHLLDDAELDHIEHYWRGGKTIPENARLTHRYCNRARGGRD